MPVEFELFFNPMVRAYGVIIRKNGQEHDKIHSPSEAELRRYLSNHGLPPSVKLPSLMLEMGMTVVIKIPKAVDAIAEPIHRLRKADFE